MSTFLTTDDTKMMTEMNEKRLLKAIIKNSPITKSIKAEEFDGQSGVDVFWRARNPYADVDGATAESVQLTNPTPIQPTSRKIKGTLYTLQNSINPSWLEKAVSYDGLRGAHELLVGNMSSSIEKHNIKFLVPDLLTFLADWDTSSPYFKRVAAASAGLTTTLVATSILTQADDYWNPSYVMPVTMTDPNYGQQRLASDFTTSDDTLTVSAAWNDLTAANMEFIIANVAALTTGDKITVATIGKIMAFMGEGSLDIPQDGDWMFSNPYGYGFRVFMSSLDYGDLMQDADYKAWATHNDKSDGFKRWSVGNVYGNEIMKYGHVYRESVARAYSATGAVFSVIGLGPQCASRKILQQPIVKIVGGRNNPSYSNPLGKGILMSWETDYAVKVTNGVDGFCLKTVPTALA